MSHGEATIDLACLVPYQPQIAPSTRYRANQYRPLLRDRAINLRLVPFATPRLQRLLYRPGHRLAKIAAMFEAFVRWLPAALGAADCVLVQREAALIGPPLVERWLSRRYPLIYDFDDAIFLPRRPGVNGRMPKWARPGGKTAALIGMSRVVLAGNAYLAAYARGFNQHVHVLPTTVDCARFVPRVGAGEPPVPTLGWIGSHSTSRYLDAIVPALAQVALTRRFRLLVVGAAHPIDIPGVECLNLLWSAEREVSDFQRLDIGLYPLEDNEWAQGKCGLKALQYGAVGIPTVCSPFGINREIVVEGATGLHARTLDEWAAALRRLLDDWRLRDAMGAAAREQVVGGYDLEPHSAQLAAIIRDIC